MFKNGKLLCLLTALASLGPMASAEAVVLDLIFDTATVETNSPSNLGGTGDLVIRYENIAPAAVGDFGFEIDAIFQSTSDYQTINPGPNGAFGGVGIVTQAGDLTVDYTLTLVEDDTTTPIDPLLVDQFFLAVIDIDGLVGQESVTINDPVVGFVAGEDIDITSSFSQGTFTGINGGNVAQPTSSTLNLEQSAVAFEVEFEQTNSVDLSYTLTGPDNRALFFTGSVDFDPAAPLQEGDFVPFEMESAAGLTLLGLGAALKLRGRNKK